MGRMCCGGCRWELIKKLCSDLSPYLYNTLDLYKTTPCLRNLCDDFHGGTLARRDWDVQTFEEVGAPRSHSRVTVSIAAALITAGHAAPRSR